MNADEMVQYVKFIANRLLFALGYENAYQDAENPFVWMEAISLQGKTNFFERRVSEYQKAGVKMEQSNKNNTFTLDEEF